MCCPENDLFPNFGYIWVFSKILLFSVFFIFCTKITNFSIVRPIFRSYNSLHLTWFLRNSTQSLFQINPFNSRSPTFFQISTNQISWNQTTQINQISQMNLKWFKAYLVSLSARSSASFLRDHPVNTHCEHPSDTSLFLRLRFTNHIHGSLIYKPIIRHKLENIATTCTVDRTDRHITVTIIQWWHVIMTYLTVHYKNFQTVYQTRHNWNLSTTHSCNLKALKPLFQSFISSFIKQVSNSSKFRLLDRTAYLDVSPLLWQDGYRTTFPCTTCTLE